MLRYIKLLWEYHREAFTDFLATILLVFAGLRPNSTFSLWEWSAIVILVGYLAYALYDTYRKYIVTSKDVSSGYSICLAKPNIAFQDAIRKQISTLEEVSNGWSVVTQQFRILDIDWQYYDGSQTIPKLWAKNISEISRHFLRYANLIPRHAALNIFLISPSAIALGIGNTIGKARDWNVYHYENDQYILLPKNADIQNANREYITVHNGSNENDNVITIVLSFTSLPTDNLVTLGENIVQVKYKNADGRIQSQDFVGIAEETAALINTFLRNGKRINLYPGLPVTLSFILGSKIEENSPVTIHNRNQETEDWEAVFQLDRLTL